MASERLEVLSERMKSYEEVGTKDILIPNLPVYCRIDGRAFHNFCKNLYKPVDWEFVKVMDGVCKDLVGETNANLGYVQSDEISLGWDKPTRAPFNGRLFKLQSVLASLASSFFWKHVVPITSEWNTLFENCLASPVSFDCRVFQVPDMEELANCFVWRELDAIRNSVLLQAQAEFSEQEIAGKKLGELIELLQEKRGIYWCNLTSRMTRGGYFQKRKYQSEMEDDEYYSIPEDKRPPTRHVTRQFVTEVEFPIMKNVENRVELYFGAEYIK